MSSEVGKRIANAEEVPSYAYLGVEVNPLGIGDLNQLVGARVRSHKRCLIMSQNLHSVYLYHHDLRVKQLSDRAFKRIDGMILVALGRLFGYPIGRHHRVTWVDWIGPLMEECAGNGWSVFYLGSQPEVCKAALATLRTRFPGLIIGGVDGYFDPKSGSSENEARVNMINECGPDILLVGMGMPRQEHWILENQDALDVSVILTCGAIMEYVTGHVRTPPRWMGQLGLEWLFRLVENPRRFWKRYLLEPWFVIWVLVQQLATRMKSARKP